MFYPDDKKHYCGMYKGYRIYQVGSMIGSGWYGKFYCSRLAKKNYVMDKNSITNTLEELKRYIDNKVLNKC